MEGINLTKKQIEIWIALKGNIAACPELDIDRIKRDTSLIDLYFHVNKHNLCWYCGVPYMKEGIPSTYNTTIGELISEVRDYLIATVILPNDDEKGNLI